METQIEAGAAVTPEAAGPGDPSVAPVRTCPNCGAPVPTPFCGHCGQRAERRLLSVRELVSDVAEDQFSVNGTFVRTVRVLVTRPGLLTTEYLAGRVARYIPPFRLFLICVAAWLLAITWQVNRMQPRMEADVHAALAKAAEKARKAGKPAPPLEIVELPVDTIRLPGFARAPLRPLARRYAQINAMDPAAAVTLVTRAFLRSGNRLMLALIPMVALLLQLLYYRRRRLYSEHFVFSLHMHSFWLLVMAVTALLPSAMVLLVLQNGVIAGYTLVAMKRVYGDGWPGTVVHGVGFAALYALMLVVLGPVATALMLM